jgi:hypothetical protein
MNPFRTTAFRALAFGLALPLAALLGTIGCDVDSTDSTTSVVSDNDGKIHSYAGLYMNTEEGSTNGYGALVFPANRQSGVKLIWLRLLQYGSVLEGYDNAGMTWAGSISAQNGAVASFGLQGRTTAGVSVDIAGTLSADEQLATMDAAWIEPGFAGSIFGTAAVSPVATNSPITTNALTLTASPTSLALNESSQLKAKYGTGSYSWPTNAAFGTITSSGDSAVYTRTSGAATDSATITVTSGSESNSVEIDFD